MESVSTTLVQEFISAYSKKKYAAAQTILHADEQPSSLFFLEEGIVRQFSTSVEGTEHTLNLYKQDTYFPLSWALNATPNRYTFEAVTACTIRSVPVSELLTFLHTQPTVVFELLQRVFKGLDGMLLKMEQQTTGDAYTKLVVSLILLARRFGTATSDGISVSLHLTQNDLAAHAGLTRETVTRLLLKLKSKKILTHKNQSIAIHDLTKLEAELSL